MEIRIASEDLTRALWIASTIFSVIGSLLAVAGLIVALPLGDGARVQEAVFPVTLVVAGIALSVIPWCLVSSVSKLLETVE